MRRPALAARLALAIASVALTGCGDISTPHEIEVGPLFAANSPKTFLSPSRTSPGAGFGIHDQQGRLEVGLVARLSGSYGYDVTLDVIHNGSSARAVVPVDALCGPHPVRILRPDGSGFDAGTLFIRQQSPGRASVSPEAGSIGTTLTISDPEGRLQSGDGVGFGYISNGTCVGPEWVRTGQGTVSADGTKLTVVVPDLAVFGQSDWLLWVGPSTHGPWRFGPLAFQLTAPAAD